MWADEGCRTTFSGIGLCDPRTPPVVASSSTGNGCWVSRGGGSGAGSVGVSGDGAGSVGVNWEGDGSVELREEDAGSVGAGGVVLDQYG